MNPNVAVVLPFLCHENEETAIERGIDGAHFFGYSLAHYYVFGQHRPARTNVWEEFEANRRDMGFAREIVRAEDAPLGVTLLQQGLGSLRGAIGTPQQIEELLTRYEEAGVDQVIFVSQAGRNRHEEICESLELFGKTVLPRFADRADEVEEAKLGRLSGAIDAALARRSLAQERRPGVRDHLPGRASPGTPRDPGGAARHAQSRRRDRRMRGSARSRPRPGPSFSVAASAGVAPRSSGRRRSGSWRTSGARTMIGSIGSSARGP